MGWASSIDQWDSSTTFLRGSSRHAEACPLSYSGNPSIPNLLTESVQTQCLGLKAPTFNSATSIGMSIFACYRYTNCPRIREQCGFEPLLVFHKECRQYRHSPKPGGGSPSYVFHQSGAGQTAPCSGYSFAIGELTNPTLHWADKGLQEIFTV